MVYMYKGFKVKATLLYSNSLKTENLYTFFFILNVKESYSD